MVSRARRRTRMDLNRRPRNVPVTTLMSALAAGSERSTASPKLGLRDLQVLAAREDSAHWRAYSARQAARHSSLPLTLEPAAHDSRS